MVEIKRIKAKGWRLEEKRERMLPVPSKES